MELVKSERKRPAYESLAEWFYGSKVELIPHRDIALQIKQVKKKDGISEWQEPVTQEELGRYVAQCRQYLESERKCTLWNVRNVGFRVATEDELAIYTAKWVRRTITSADRTTRLTDIVDRKRMPNALRKVFLDNEGRIRNLTVRGQKFMKTFVEYLAVEKKKMLEHKEGENDEEKGKGRGN